MRSRVQGAALGVPRFSLAKVSVFIGRNLYSSYPAVSAWLSLEAASSASSEVDLERARHIVRRVIAETGGVALAEPLAIEQEPGDALDAAALLIGWTTAELQNVVGAGVTDFGAGKALDGACLALCGYQEPISARAAMMIAGRTVDAVLAGEIRGDGDLPDNLRHGLKNALDLVRRANFDIHTGPIIAAARARGIPVYPVKQPYPLVQLGQGAMQRHLMRVMIDGYDHIGLTMCRNKELSQTVLRRIGVPVPEQRRAESAQQAKRIAAALGYPVVIKPGEGHGGNGVTVDIREPAEVGVAYDRAIAAKAGAALVEKYVAGDDHRLVLIDRRLVAAVKRVPGHVVGDGRSSVGELIAGVNDDPRRGIAGERALTRLKRDDEAKRMLARRGYDFDSVPPENEIVWLRATANLSTGGTAVDVMDRVHPSVREMAETVARAFKVGVIALDYLTPDIARPAADVGGFVCEVNASPGLRPHMAVEGSFPALLDAVLARSFAPGENARIPVAMITGTSGKTTTARMVAAMVEAAGLRAGLACSDGVIVGSRVLRVGDSSGSESTRMLVFDPTVEAIVAEIARGGLVRFGVPLDRCDVGAVLNVSSEHLGQDGVETIDHLARAKALVIEAATRLAVLDADDPHCHAMAGKAGAPVCWVGLTRNSPRIGKHVEDGGVAVYASGTGQHAVLVLEQGGLEPVEVVRIADIPSAWGGILQANVRNALHAAAIGHGLGLPRDAIAAGLASFRGDLRSNPGRFTVFATGDRRGLIDRATSVADLDALDDLVGRLAVGGRRIAALTHVGNARDEDIRAFAERAATAFDEFVCYDWDDLRGRNPGEIAGMLAEGLRRAGVEPARVAVVPSESEAIARALAAGGPEDLRILVMIDEAEDIVPLMERLGVDMRDCPDYRAWLAAWGAQGLPADAAT